MPKNNKSDLTEQKHVKKRIKVEPTVKNEILSSESEDEIEYKRKKDEAKTRYRIERDEADDIGEILEKKIAEDLLTQREIQHLRNLTITLRHEVLPQHEVERACGSHVPSYDEKATFRKIIYPNEERKGVFSPDEDQIIVDNWKEFCRMHDWNHENAKAFLYFRHKPGFYLPKLSERMKFVQFLADGLPYRSLYSVYHRFRNLYDTPKVRSKYTFDEDRYIIQYIEKSKNVEEKKVFSDLAKVLNRTRCSVYRRYRLLRRNREANCYDD